MGFPGPTEWIILLLIILLLFGSKKLPELARSIGKALKSSREGQKTSPMKYNRKKTTRMNPTDVKPDRAKNPS